MITMQNPGLVLKRAFVVGLVSAFGILTIAAVILGEAPEGLRIGQLYLEKGFELGNVSNAVFGVYGVFRFYDTLFELMIFSMAVLGITVFSDLEASQSSDSEKLVESHVVTASASFLYPIVAVFGFYLAFSAHLGPGGGFAAGVIGGSGVLLLALSKGASETGRRFHEDEMKRVEYMALIFALGVAVFGSLYSGRAYGGLPGLGTIVSVNIAIGMKVFIGTWAILHFFVKHRGEV